MLFSICLGLLSGLWVFSYKHKHILLTLLSIEFIVLFFFMFLYLVFPLTYLYFTLIYLTFTACEGALGLSLLVSVMRSFGADYVSSFNTF